MYNSKQLKKSPGNWQDKFREFIIGKMVMTRYNHTCYRIDDIDWSLNPLGTFTRRGEEVRI